MEGGKPAIVQKWEHIYETAFAKAKTEKAPSLTQTSAKATVQSW